MTQGKTSDHIRKPSDLKKSQKTHKVLSKKKSGQRSDQKANRSVRRVDTSLLCQGIPSFLEDIISQYIKEKTGKSCDDPVFLERLRHAIMGQKAMYWKDKPGKSVKYGRGYDIFSYLAYHLPVYFTQFRSLLQKLENDKILPSDAVILDIGTGPGVVPLAMIDLWNNQGKGSLDIYAIERSPEHGEAFRFLVGRYAGNNPLISVHPVVQEDLIKITSLKRSDLPQKATIISFQNVLAELEHLSITVRAEIVLSYARLLDEHGFLIIVEPAELRHATSLRLLQKELIKAGFYVYAPCSYLWGSGCDPSSCWTFREEPSISPTTLMTLLAGEEEGYRYINTDLKYAYVILTPHQVARSGYRVPRKNRLVRLSQLERYEGRTISVAGSRMSEDIGSRGMHIFKICDGTCREPVYIVISSRNRRPGHAPLFSSSYGEPLIISGVQVRRHQKHHAWNLIINADSRVERAFSAADKPSNIKTSYENHDENLPYSDNLLKSDTNTIGNPFSR